MGNENRFRMAASSLSVLSYLLITHEQRSIGVLLNLICQGCLVPFCLKHRAWDMVALSGLFGGINIHILISELL